MGLGFGVHTCSVAVVVVNWCAGTVDGELFEVGTAVTVELGVQIGEETALEEGILGEINAADDMTRLELNKLVLLVGDDRLRHTMTCSVSAK
jgi:hypothetical protein